MRLIAIFVCVATMLLTGATVPQAPIPPAPLLTVVIRPPHPTYFVVGANDAAGAESFSNEIVVSNRTGALNFAWNAALPAGHWTNYNFHWGSQAGKETNFIRVGNSLTATWPPPGPSNLVVTVSVVVLCTTNLFGAWTPLTNVALCVTNPPESQRFFKTAPLTITTRSY